MCSKFTYYTCHLCVFHIKVPTFELCFPEDHKNKMEIKILILISHTKGKEQDNYFLSSVYYIGFNEICCQ